jgi:hypothetical protein
MRSRVNLKKYTYGVVKQSAFNSDSTSKKTRPVKTSFKDCHKAVYGDKSDLEIEFKAPFKQAFCIKLASPK